MLDLSSEISHYFFVWRCRSNILKNIGSAEVNIITGKYEWFLKIFLLHGIYMCVRVYVYVYIYIYINCNNDNDNNNKA